MTLPIDHGRTYHTTVLHKWQTHKKTQKWAPIGIFIKWLKEEKLTKIILIKLSNNKTKSSIKGLNLSQVVSY